MGYDALTGRVLECLEDDLYRIELDDGHKVICHRAGRARFQAVRILPGDRVQVVRTSGNPGRGRILVRVE